MLIVTFGAISQNNGKHTQKNGDTLIVLSVYVIGAYHELVHSSFNFDLRVGDWRRFGVGAG